MYYDISLTNNNSIELSHLIKSLTNETYVAAAVDYPFTDCTISQTPLKDSFPRLQQISGKKIKLYSRATLQIEQTASLHQLNQISNNGFDITALKPKTQKIFHSICVEYDNYDVITLDIGQKLPFMLKRNPVYEALRKGKYFQIQYQPIFDDNTRIIAMTNIINLIKATNGKNIIVSSHSDSITHHRTPYDVAALLATLGLDKNKALATMKENVEEMLKSAMHRKFFKSTVTEIPQILVQKLGKRIKKHKMALRKLPIVPTFQNR